MANNQEKDILTSVVLCALIGAGISGSKGAIIGGVIGFFIGIITSK